MSTVNKTINESSLRTDLSDLAHGLIRELAGAFKKMAIYGSDHPQARRAVEKPFMLISRIFLYKKFVNLNLQKGQLYLINIQLKETIFNSQIIQYMQLRDINALLFDQVMTADEFTLFVQQLVSRADPADRQARIGVLLKEKDIHSIQVNTELAYHLFEKQRQYRGDVEGDFSVKKLALGQLSDQLKQLVKISGADEAK